MIDLFDQESGALLGSITENELQLLIDSLEEESDTSQSYFIEAATISLLGDGRATDHLLHLLRTALGARDGVEIRWARR